MCFAEVIKIPSNTDCHFVQCIILHCSTVHCPESGNKMATTEIHEYKEYSAKCASVQLHVCCSHVLFYSVEMYSRYHVYSVAATMSRAI